MFTSEENPAISQLASHTPNLLDSEYWSCESRKFLRGEKILTHYPSLCICGYCLTILVLEDLETFFTTFLDLHTSHKPHLLKRPRQL